MKYIKRIIKYILKLFNLGIHPVDNSKAYLIGPIKRINQYPLYLKRLLASKYVPTNDECLKKLIKKENPLIFDIGGNIGDSIERFSKIFKNPEIYSFDPLKDNYKILKQKQSSRIKTFNFAFGDRKESKLFFESADSPMSSFNEYNNPNNKNSYNVSIKKLDEFLEEERINVIDILKIDTQGYEEKILKGAKNSLNENKFKIIELELQIGNLYKDEHKNFIDIEQYLIANNYRLFSIDRFGNLFQNPTLEFNLIYVTKELIELNEIL